MRESVIERERERKKGKIEEVRAVEIETVEVSPKSFLKT